MGNSVIVPIILLVVLLVFGIFFIVKMNKQDNDTSKKDTSNKSKDGKNEKSSDIAKEDVFKFMEFDKIMDSMIVQNNGQKYTMAVKCKGINYDLMSENEQLAVEEGFITFLNTLKFPIQIYVQAQNIDLKKTISKYNENLQGIVAEYDQANNEYNQVINSLDSTKDEIKRADYNKKSIQNVLEYATDIVKYVERLSVNKSLLQRSFYIIFSYYTSEITSISNFSKDEIENICYNELYTRAMSIISALASCSVSGTVLTSNELAGLLYNSYNRDDSKYIDIEKALESGYYRLYSTSEDAFKKREALLEEQINNEAQIRAYESIKKAIESGEYKTPETKQIELDQEISKAAIDIIRNENLDDDLKESAKDIVIEKYKEDKQKILNNMKKDVKQAKQEENKEDTAKVNQNINDNLEDEKINIKSSNNTIIEDKKQRKEDNIINTLDTNDAKLTENNDGQGKLEKLEQKEIKEDVISSKDVSENDIITSDKTDTINVEEKKEEKLISEETNENKENKDNKDSKEIKDNKENIDNNANSNDKIDNSTSSTENNDDDIISGGSSEDNNSEKNDNNDFEDDFFDSII